MFWDKKKTDKQSEKSLSKNDIRKLIIDLRLPRIILQLFDGNLCDDIANSHFLSDRYKAPFIFIDHPTEELKHYKVDRYVPFLSIYQSTVFAYDNVANKFVSYRIEYFREDNLERLSWDGLFIEEVCAWWEDEWPDADIVHIGDLLGLQHTKELIDKIALHDEEGGDESYFEWKKSLKKKFGGLVE